MRHPGAIPGNRTRAGSVHTGTARHSSYGSVLTRRLFGESQNHCF
uniref:Uncharacterized protein n=1 Tax=Arundo donax TaxID=35708 RepID=A0A0A9DAC4_ARUDO